MNDILLMTGSLTVGIIMGRFTGFVVSSDLITVILMILVFLVGIDIGREEGILKRIKMNMKNIIIQSLLTIVGTFAFALLLSFFLPYSAKELIGASAGFGWYSLSGIMISQLYSPLLGTISFMSNVFRELLSIIFIPILSKINQRASISMAGATSMDVLLSLISKTTSRKNTLIAFGQGVTLSLIVPIIISLIFL
jgi:uncharacterized membrane protein YbjE (DUF340 family)